MKKSRILYDENEKPIEIVEEYKPTIKEKLIDYLKDCAVRAIQCIIILTVAIIMIIIAGIILKYMY